LFGDLEHDVGWWYVNRHGVVFAVVNDLYFALDTPGMPALADL